MPEDWLDPTWLRVPGGRSDLARSSLRVRMRAGSAGVPTTPRGALLDSAFARRLQGYRFERQRPRVLHRWKRARAFAQEDVCSRLNIHGNDQRPRVGFQACILASERGLCFRRRVAFSDDREAFQRSVERNRRAGGWARSQHAGQGHCFEHAQMAPFDESGTAYLRLRLARESCPRASIEAVAEPDRRMTAERLNAPATEQFGDEGQPQPLRIVSDRSSRAT